MIVLIMKCEDFFTNYNVTKNLQIYEASSIRVSFIAYERDIFPFATKELT